MRNVRWPVVKDAHDFLQIITTEDIQATVEICDYNLPISRIPHNGIFGIGESVLLVCYRLAESLFSNWFGSCLKSQSCTKSTVLISKDRLPAQFG